MLGRLFRKAKSTDRVDLSELPPPSAESIHQPLNHLPKLRERALQGAAAENYVSKILDEFRRGNCIVDRGLIAGKELVGEHVGDIDFLVEHRRTGASVVIEVKSSDPWIPANDARFRLRDSHHWQAARGAWAIQQITGGLRMPFPVVTYVAPHQKESRLLLNLPVKVEHQPESCYPIYPVRSVGAAKLRNLLWWLLLDHTS